MSATGTVARLPDGWARRGAVFAGGLAGTGLRAAVAAAFGSEPAAWPWATFLANLSGALLLGFLVGWAVRRGGAPHLTLSLLGTGLLGSYTTFSTLTIEVVRIADAGDVVIAAGYGVTSVVAGLAAAALGHALARPIGRGIVT